MSHRLRTYVVEDSSVIRDNLKEALHENAPVDVVGCAEDERAAVDWLLDPRNRCDLVIVDIFLKSGSGLGVLKQVARRSPPLRCVVLSNHATPEVRAKCTELGAERVFDKSNEIDEMLGYFNRLAPRVEEGYSIPSSL
jgi:DNA-binding NarL/FixJ family response regulator